jgi:flavin-dependent dehydrogenase
MTRYDVVVVGGRVAGASTALLLARAGARVALLDRSRPGSDIVSTHALMRAGVVELSRWGLLDQIISAGTPPIRSTTFHYPDGRTVRVAIRPGPGVPALYAPRRYLLDWLLVDAAAQAGVDVITQTSVTTLTSDDTGRITGVRAVGRGGRSVELSSSITVGADGIRSTVAQHVAAPVLRQGRSRSAFLYRYLGGLRADGYEWAYRDNAAAGLIPTNHGQTCMFVGTTPQRMRAARRHDVEHAFTTVLGYAAPAWLDRVAEAESVGPIHGWGGTPGYVRQSWGPGWALVGDAGYYKDAITTHGMTDALRDAELLADAITERPTDGSTEAIAFARYQQTRDRLSSDLFAATEDVAAYEWTPDTIETLLRRVSAAMTDEVSHLQTLANPAHIRQPDSLASR